MSTPRVSVIVIFLNAERFLEEAIASVFAQQLQDWELLLVDDGSTDRSSAIARDVAQAHPEKVRYLEHFGHVNRGMSATRNLGVAHARGEYVAFLDADDVWLPEKLATMVPVLDQHAEVGLVYGLTEWWFSWTGAPADADRDYIHELGVPACEVIDPPGLLAPMFFDQTAAIPGPTTFMCRRCAMAQIGGFEESFTGIHQAYEDQAFLAKMCLAYPVIAVDTCLDRYRQHPTSIVTSVERAGKSLQTRRFFLEWLSSLLDEQGVTDPRILQGMEAALRPHRHPLRHHVAGVVPVARQLVFKGLVSVGSRTLPAAMRRRLWSIWNKTPYQPPPGSVRFGSLRRTTPMSREFGYDRGLPVDRYYIERFLAEHSDSIHGRVLEIADNAYTLRFGGDQVTTSDVLHVVEGNPKATIVGDLTTAEHIPSCAFDCVIFTQTMQLIYDPAAALRTIHRILKPGGTVLATFPGISPISRYDMDRWGYYWSYTSRSATQMFSEAFAGGRVEVQSFGNVLSASSLLYGLASDELTPAELDVHDPDFEVIITVRAIRSPVAVSKDDSVYGRESRQMQKAD